MITLMSIKVEHNDDVSVLTLGEGENRLTPEWMAEVEAALDELEARPAPRALVTHAEGKIWSNGLDLDWLHGRSPEEVRSYVDQVHELLARFLGASVFTVAAVQGHAFGAGAMLALAHDQRVMRADRGFLCLPEADVDVPFTPGMTALLQSKLPTVVRTELMVGALRLGGDDALQAGVVTRAVEADDVLAEAVEMAGAHAGKTPATLATIKGRLYARELVTLRDRSVNAMSFQI